MKRAARTCSDGAQKLADVFASRTCSHPHPTTTTQLRTRPTRTALVIKKRTSGAYGTPQPFVVCPFISTKISAALHQGTGRHRKKGEDHGRREDLGVVQKLGGEGQAGRPHE